MEKEDWWILVIMLEIYYEFSSKDLEKPLDKLSIWYLRSFQIEYMESRRWNGCLKDGKKY